MTAQPWTFPDDVDQDEIEACLALLEPWDDDDDAGGFVDAIVFAVHYMGPDGEDHYVYRTVTGATRMMTTIGLLEAVKIGVMQQSADGPFSEFLTRDDD